jgi:hypothetical protein
VSFVANRERYAGLGCGDHKLEYAEMKLATVAIAATIALTMAPLPSQAFFLNEETLNYKLHIVECLGLLFSERHADECGGAVTGPFNTLASPGSPSGPAAAPVVVPPVVEVPTECPTSSFVEGLEIGERVHVAVSCYDYED